MAALKGLSPNITSLSFVLRNAACVWIETKERKERLRREGDKIKSAELWAERQQFTAFKASRLTWFAYKGNFDCVSRIRRAISEWLPNVRAAYKIRFLKFGRFFLSRKLSTFLKLSKIFMLVIDSLQRIYMKKLTSSKSNAVFLKKLIHSIATYLAGYLWAKSAVRQTGEKCQNFKRKQWGMKIMPTNKVD